MNVLSVFERPLMGRRRSRRSFRGILEPLKQRLAPATSVVNSTADQSAVDPSKGAETASSGITLRSAIQAANEHANDQSGPDRIESNIPEIDVQMIAPFSPFPAITDPIVIDGYTQPRAKANKLDVGDDADLKINVYDKFGFASGMTISAGNSTVRGLVFTNFGNHALTLTDHGGNVIAGNFFGLPASGGVSIGNGVALYVGFGANGNVIGGTSPADRNVMSGNGQGVRIVASSNNVIQGNYLGVEPDGGEPLGNGLGGIVVASGVAGETIGPATGNLIGGTVAGARNIISANGGGSQTSSGVDFSVGSLGAGETRQFQIVVRPVNTQSITLTASASADPNVTLGRPASVTTNVVGPDAGETPPPTVTRQCAMAFTVKPRFWSLPWTRT